MPTVNLTEAINNNSDNSSSNNNSDDDNTTDDNSMPELSENSYKKNKKNKHKLVLHTLSENNNKNQRKQQQLIENNNSNNNKQRINNEKNVRMKDITNHNCGSLQRIPEEKETEDDVSISVCVLRFVCPCVVSVFFLGRFITVDTHASVYIEMFGYKKKMSLKLFFFFEF